MDKYRYFIRLSYRGTAYHGWQTQPGSITVQETVEKSLSVILQEEISITGCGRTDTGVHARYFIAHFDTSHKLNDNKDNRIHRLNCHLPDDIEISNIFPVSNDSHARFDALSRTYEYNIIRHKDPFLNDLSWYRSDCFSLSEMNKASDLLMNYRDFTSFSRTHTDVKTNNCIITHARWFNTNGGLVFIIRADRFLRNMVRAIVGTMIDVGTGKMSINEFEEVIKARDRGSAGMSVPAKGLFLTLVEYPYPVF